MSIFSNKDNLINWLITVHNNVNTKLNKNKQLNRTDVNKIYLHKNKIKIDYNKINIYLKYITKYIDNSILNKLFKDLFIIFPYNNNKISLNLNIYNNNYNINLNNIDNIINIINNDKTKLNKLIDINKYNETLLKHIFVSNLIHKNKKFYYLEIKKY